jgi:hypothetical protein
LSSASRGAIRFCIGLRRIRDRFYAAKEQVKRDLVGGAGVVINCFNETALVEGEAAPRESGQYPAKWMVWQRPKQNQDTYRSY